VWPPLLVVVVVVIWFTMLGIGRSKLDGGQTAARWRPLSHSFPFRIAVARAADLEAISNGLPQSDSLRRPDRSTLGRLRLGILTSERPA
jgi:hypothetical protein